MIISKIQLLHLYFFQFLSTAQPKTGLMRRRTTQIKKQSSRKIVPKVTVHTTEDTEQSKWHGMPSLLFGRAGRHNIAKMQQQRLKDESLDYPDTDK